MNTAACGDGLEVGRCSWFHSAGEGCAPVRENVEGNGLARVDLKEVLVLESCSPCSSRRPAFRSRSGSYHRYRSSWTSFQQRVDAAGSPIGTA